MGTRRCGISFRAFNSIAHEWAQWTSEMSSWTRQALQATMYCVVYHINAIALYWQEKLTSSMNENKRIDNPNNCREHWR